MSDFIHIDVLIVISLGTSQMRPFIMW